MYACVTSHRRAHKAPVERTGRIDLHMYPKIIALIDEQLDRLGRARALLAGAAAAPAMAELEATTAEQAPEAEPVTVTRVRSSTRGMRRQSRTRPARVAEPTALSGRVASGPVAVAASEVRRAPEPRPAAEAPASAGEGTLDALIEELTGAGKRDGRAQDGTARQ